jgi:N-formylglutamate amidohydrolase
MPSREHAAIAAELTPPHAVIEPTNSPVPFVFCSPHSGRIYPAGFLAAARLDALALRRSEDCYVDELLGGVARLGAPLLAARFPRAYLDVNREPYELDPELFSGPLPDFANPSTMRVIGGLGTIARIVADSEEIYREKPSLGMALARIELLYKPFHAALARLLERTCRQFGYAVLVDCHSMPSISASAGQGPRPDFVIGDRFGGSCDNRVTRALREALALRGAQVQLNRPYAGGYITEHYGRPYRGVHAIQLEINRGLYLDEATLSPSAGFQALRLGLTEALARTIVEVRSAFERRAAAE